MYVTARHEKKISDQLRKRGVHEYLPLYPSVREWKGRRARVDLPLFPSYVFVHIAIIERLRVLEIPGVVHIVSFGGSAVALADREMEALSSCLGGRLPAEPCPYLGPGSRVRVTAGPLHGLEGTLIRDKGRSRFIITAKMAR